MKDVNEIKDLIRITRSIEVEAHNYICERLPMIGEKLVSELFDLIMDHGKDFHLGLTPEIELDVDESKAYLRILPIEAGSRMSSSDRVLFFPSHDLYTLLEVKDCELYSRQLRDNICCDLANEIKRGLKSLSIKSKIKYEFNFLRDVKSYKIILKF